MCSYFRVRVIRRAAQFCMSSMIGSGCNYLLSAKFRICGSMHTRMSPDFFSRMAILLTHSVGLSPFWITELCSRSLSFAASFFFILMGTRDDITALGMIDSSSVRCTGSDNLPSSLLVHMVTISVIIVHCTDILIVHLYHTHLF